MEKLDLLRYLEKKGYPEKVITSFVAVERERFVPEHMTNYAYEDIALPLADGSTIPAPSTIAFMLELLELNNNQKVLEVGSGSGYVSALMSPIIKEGIIYGVELNKNLAAKSKENLENYSNIHIINKSGFYGYSEKAPFDRILISASFEEKPYYLMSQLSDNGILVSAVKDTIIQLKKIDGEVKEQVFYGFSFVPMIKDD